MYNLIVCLVADLHKACESHHMPLGRLLDSSEMNELLGFDQQTLRYAKDADYRANCQNLPFALQYRHNTFSRPDETKVYRFCELMKSKGINTTVRRTLGGDIDASCGQLRRKSREEGIKC